VANQNHRKYLVNNSARGVSGWISLRHKGKVDLEMLGTFGAGVRAALDYL
jgi:hypothetical protein